MKEKSRRAHRPTPYNLALGLQHPDRQLSGAGHAGQSPFCSTRGFIPNILARAKRGQELIIDFCSKRLSGSEEFFEHGLVGVRADDGNGEA